MNTLACSKQKSGQFINSTYECTFLNFLQVFILFKVEKNAEAGLPFLVTLSLRIYIFRCDIQFRKDGYNK